MLIIIVYLTQKLKFPITKKGDPKAQKLFGTLSWWYNIYYNDFFLYFKFFDTIFYSKLKLLAFVRVLL
jgi:hypothetical protein